MKIFRFTIAVVLTSAVLFSCDTAKKVKETTDNLSAAKNAAENMQEGMEAANKRIEERKAKGDTLAMPYKDLQAYLPSISGYTADGGPSGSTTNMMGFSLSTCEQNYKKGDSNIKVKITDYNAGYSAFMGITAMMKAGFSSEDDNQKAGGVNMGVDGVAGYETIYKKDKRAQLILAIADRFYIELEGDNLDNSEALQTIAKDMKLSDLAAK
ncbi:MAG: hypothetical protein U0Y10_05185 [Spirosomataceae bacterium]